MVINKSIKRIAKKFLGRQEPCNCSYSQEGEDILLKRIIGHIHYPGTFVDIGAHHPVKFSNTYLFYQAGWRGINIAATPGSIDLFNQLRPHDINLEIPVSDKVEELTFYIFNYAELNTFSEEQVREWDGKGDVRLVDEIKLKTSTITSILERHYPAKTNFDLLSIDVEGLDIRILKSIDFNTYKFKYIIAEDEPGNVNVAINGKMTEYLSSKGYTLLSKLYYSNIYVLNDI